MFLSVRLSDEIEGKLKKESAKRGLKRSELVRDILEAHLTTYTYDERQDKMWDDWGDFGSRLIQAQQEVFGQMVSKLYAEPWRDLGAAMEKVFARIIDEMWTTPDEHGCGSWYTFVVPLYDLFKRKVMEKSKALRSPRIYPGARGGPPIVVAAIGFAADDICEVQIPLEDVFYEYCWDAGEEAFNAIPAIWAKAKERLGGEDQEAVGRARLGLEE